MSSLQWLWWSFVALSSTMVLSIAATYMWAISPGHASHSTAKLPYSPNQISLSEMIRANFLLVIKSLTPGLTSRLRPSGQASSGTFHVPKIELTGKLRFEEEQIKLFDRAVRGETKVNGLANPFFLFAQTNALIILLLAHKESPIKPLGSVNTQNTFRFIHPRLCCDITTLKRLSQEGKLSFEARLGDEPGIRRKRGIEFSTIIDIFSSDELILNIKFSFLQFLPSSFEPRFVAQQNEKPQSSTRVTAEDVVEQTITLTPADPKRWAPSCKDYNLIHISTLAAKLLGFPRVIAHGNHVAALALQQYFIDVNNDRELQQPQQRQQKDTVWSQDRPVELNLKFIRPVTLPAKLNCAWSGTPSKLEEFVIRSSHNGKEVLQGAISILDETSTKTIPGR